MTKALGLPKDEGIEPGNNVGRWCQKDGVVPELAA